MATPYSNIFDIFLSQVDDSTLITVDISDEIKKRYLFNSIPRFRRCKKDLVGRDETNGKFNADLSDEEQLILGVIMVTEYLNFQVISLNNLRQVMSNKDFNVNSQAAHLNQLISLRKMKMDEVNKLIVDYTYNNSDLSDLK